MYVHVVYALTKRYTQTYACVLTGGNYTVTDDDYKRYEEVKKNAVTYQIQKIKFITSEGMIKL